MPKLITGFTLVELLITVTIIGILTSVGGVVYSGLQKDARDQKRFQDLRLIQQNLESYRAKNGVYPTSAPTEINATTALPSSLPNLTPFPADPTSTRHYAYKALPLNCNNSTASCTDYVLCAKKEGEKLSSYSCSDSLSCESPNDCNLGVTAK